GIAAVASAALQAVASAFWAKPGVASQVNRRKKAATALANRVCMTLPRRCIIGRSTADGLVEAVAGPGITFNDIAVLLRPTGASSVMPVVEPEGEDTCRGYRNNRHAR